MDKSRIFKNKSRKSATCGIERIGSYFCFDGHIWILRFFSFFVKFNLSLPFRFEAKISYFIKTISPILIISCARFISLSCNWLFLISHFYSNTNLTLLICTYSQIRLLYRLVLHLRNSLILLRRNQGFFWSYFSFPAYSKTCIQFCSPIFQPLKEHHPSFQYD